MKSATKALSKSKKPLVKISTTKKKTEEKKEVNKLKEKNKINTIDTTRKNKENINQINKIENNEDNKDNLTKIKTKIKTLIRKPKEQQNNISLVQVEPIIKKKKKYKRF